MTIRQTTLAAALALVEDFMPRLSVLLVLFFLAAPADPVSAATSGVPKLDVSQSCDGLQTTVATAKIVPTSVACRTKKKRMIDSWKNGRISIYGSLGQGIAPAPSYVEILTCLEMAEDARAIENPGDIPARTGGGTRSAASSAPISVRSPNARVGGVSDLR
jgi:hypothetical protein